MLRTIILVFNNMKGTIITEINRLVKLGQCTYHLVMTINFFNYFLQNPTERFIISENSLVRSISTQLGSLQHLKEINLSDNYLTRSMPLMSNKFIEEITLSSKYLTGLIPLLPEKLTILNLKHNLLNGTLSDPILAT